MACDELKREDHTQVNVRVPEDAREFLLNIAAKLRADPDFLPRAEAWLAGVQVEAAMPSIADRLQALEGSVACLVARDKGARGKLMPFWLRKA